MPKSRITVGTITNWMGLVKLAEECADERWVFRGETDAGRLLRPKAGRVKPEKGAARKRAHDKADEIAALKLFQRQSRPYIVHEPQNDIEWLAIAQHHGMSTRLLDWTESILVAAYFACTKAGTAGDGILYGARDLPTVTPEGEKEPFDVRDVSMYRPPHIATRIPAQRSVFTLHPDPVTDFTNEVTKWRIQADSGGVIKRILDACAINEASLFPDIDGLSRYIGWRYKWGKL